MTKINTLRNSKLTKTQSIPKNNPLLTDLDNTDPVSRRSMKAELWFQKDCFKDIDEEDDEGVDMDKIATTYKEKGSTLLYICSSIFLYFFYICSFWSWQVLSINK